MDTMCFRHPPHPTQGHVRLDDLGSVSEFRDNSNGVLFQKVASEDIRTSRSECDGHFEWVDSGFTQKQVPEFHGSLSEDGYVIFTVFEQFIFEDEFLMLLLCPPVFKFVSCLLFHVGMVISFLVWPGAFVVKFFFRVEFVGPNASFNLLEMILKTSSASGCSLKRTRTV